MTGARTSHIKSILGLSLERGKMQGVLATRNGVGIHVKKSFCADLSLDPLSSDPELFGQELLSCLKENGIYETQCVVCLPMQWVLSHQIELPELSDEDRDHFIHLQSERAFPFPLDELSLSISRFGQAQNKDSATIAAVPVHYLNALGAALKAAKLKPLSFTIAYPDSPSSSHAGRVILQKKETGLDFLVQVGEGIASLRWFDNETEDIEMPYVIDPATVLREIRITLGQYPDEIRHAINELWVTGDRTWQDRWVPEVQDGIKQMGFNLDIPVLSSSNHPWDMNIDPVFIPLHGALSRFLLNKPCDFEFLPPRVHRLKQWMSKVSSRSTMMFSGTVAAIVLMGLGVLMYQSIQLSQLQSQWDGMKDRVTEVEQIQKQVKQFRDWYTVSIPSLEAIQTLTQAFPEEGSLWTKVVEIKDIHTVSCSGFAKSNRALLTALDRLNESEQVNNLQVQHVQGKEPLQFSFNFYWTEG